MAPETIILDTREVMRKIRYAASHSDHEGYAAHVEGFVQDLTNETVQCLRERPKAALALDHLVQEIASNQCNAGGGIVPPELAPLVEELGKSVLQQLDANKAFNLQGRLPYHYYIPPWKVDEDDIMLTRTQGITAE